jgi:hypothetical protein
MLDIASGRDRTVVMINGTTFEVVGDIQFQLNNVQCVTLQAIDEMLLGTLIEFPLRSRKPSCGPSST